MANNIMQYESKVWSTADSLISVGIKQSDFPKFMMPFFALVLVESRLLRMKEELEKSGDKLDKEDFLEEMREEGKGYNRYLFEKEKTLKDICKNDKTFEIDFDAYMKGFDDETKDLLGIDKSNEEEKFLDISGISGQLKKKKIFFAFVKGWSEIDLKPFSNSEITTLEEHIKRKWADISAETAGEQYTPDDVIALISEIVNAKIAKNEEFLTIYDPSCGGGNLLFGAEDRIKESTERPIATYGQDWSDSLYALAKIESRFRDNSSIEYGNTLTSTKFYDKAFDVVVANPPQGITWKDFSNDIYNDKTGQYHFTPSTSDGQLLFNQHIISRLNKTGFAVVVHNGSALFSGDAGSGESNIRKWLFDHDLVEAIIQLPTDEFFNTGIFTYLWVLNKNKPNTKKKKVMLIDASNKFRLLKKNKGKKRKEIDEVSKKEIIKTFLEYKDNSYSKVFDRDYFYFNKQSIILTNLDENGISFEQFSNGKKSLKLDAEQITQKNEDGGINIGQFLITNYDKGKFDSLKSYNDKIKERLSNLNYKDNLRVETNGAVYYVDNEKETLIKEVNGKKEELGCGKINVKSSYKRATKSKSEEIVISVELIPDYEKDYEIIPYSENEEENKKKISEFMKKYVSKPFVYSDNVVGVEINFNKIFYKPEKLRALNVIIEELQEQNETIKKDLIGTTFNENLLIHFDKKKFNSELLNVLPTSWDIKRVKNLFGESKDISQTGKEDLLSVSEYTGVNKKKKDEETGENSTRADSLIGYKLCKKDDLVINIMLAWKRGLGVSPCEGIVSPAYAVYHPISKIYPKYYHYLFRTDLYISEFKKYSTGIIDSRLRLYSNKFFAIPAIIPKYEEQKKISDHLDEKIVKIDKIVYKLKKQIITLTEFKKTLINDVVTGKVRVQDE